MVITPLKWDSEFFQMRIAKVEVKTEAEIRVLAHLGDELRHSFDLIYLFAEPGVKIPLNGAKLVDKKIVYTMSSPLNGRLSSHIVQIAPYEPTDAIISLALKSGEYSRFRLDNSFAPGSFDKLYTHWIKKSLDLSIATEVFCYMINDLPSGLVTLERKENESSIGLVAVDTKHQHRGIGTALIQHIISFVEGYQDMPIFVTTQMDNKPACKLYSKCGFTISSAKDIWHWWL